MRLFLVPLLFFGLPLAEIAGFVIVGNWLGLWPTLALVILSCLAGTLLLRVQGLSLLRQISEESRQGRVPGEALVNGAMIVIAAFLLLLPGFISDIIGILLFIPPVRRLLWQLIGRHVIVTTTMRGAGPRPGGPVGPDDRTIDLDETDYQRKPNPSSPWVSRPKDEP